MHSASACICGPEQDRSGLIFFAWEELYEHQRRRKDRYWSKSQIADEQMPV